MPQAHSTPSPKPIYKRPTCLKCGVEMWLAPIEPTGEHNHDRRTFECPICQDSQTVVVKFTVPTTLGVLEIIVHPSPPVTHHVHILEMNGDSYRLNQSKRRSRRASSDSPPDTPTQA